MDSCGLYICFLELLKTKLSFLKEYIPDKRTILPGGEKLFTMETVEALLKQPKEELRKVKVFNRC